MQMDNILNLLCMRLNMDNYSVINFVYFSKRCSFTAKFVISRVLKFPKVRHLH